MRGPACSAGGESRRRFAGWAGYTAGSNRRSAEKRSASRNRGNSFLVRMMIAASDLIWHRYHLLPHRLAPPGEMVTRRRARVDHGRVTQGKARPATGPFVPYLGGVAPP